VVSLDLSFHLKPLLLVEGFGFEVVWWGERLREREWEWGWSAILRLGGGALVCEAKGRGEMLVSWEERKENVMEGSSFEGMTAIVDAKGFMTRAVIDTRYKVAMQPRLCISIFPILIWYIRHDEAVDGSFPCAWLD